ncbi:MAG: hypothetical protein ACT4NV_18030 [Rhodoferax sp.]
MKTAPHPHGGALSNARFPFAPGVIEGGPARLARTGVPLVVGLAIVLVCLGALAAVVGFAAGYLNWTGAWL